jgi:hypothetical protein
MEKHRLNSEVPLKENGLQELLQKISASPMVRPELFVLSPERPATTPMFRQAAGIKPHDPVPELPEFPIGKFVNIELDLEKSVSLAQPEETTLSNHRVCSEPPATEPARSHLISLGESCSAPQKLPLSAEVEASSDCVARNLEQSLKLFGGNKWWRGSHAISGQTEGDINGDTVQAQDETMCSGQRKGDIDVLGSRLAQIDSWITTCPLDDQRMADWSKHGHFDLEGDSVEIAGDDFKDDTDDELVSIKTNMSNPDSGMSVLFFGQCKSEPTFTSM